eukprot:TRINITY_DN8484_c0_g1_i1.p1 TRINITY_DN8484_c0_g1~~TRINITY_DN8484_c0_g1_i1.p1  ORF type:complete len:292 (+),score=69.25 TRINITY_DN8484_c0_g1_i1:291-1166(+)
MKGGGRHKSILVEYGTDHAAHISDWFRFVQLFKRDWAVYIRDPFRLAGRVMNGTAMGLLIGILYTSLDVTQIANWCLIVLEIPALSSMVVMPIFFIDRPFMNLERSAGLYTTLPYYLAQWITSLVSGLIGNFFLVLIAFAFSGFPWEAFMFTFFAACVQFVAFESLLTASAYASKDQTQALGIFNGTIGIFLLFNGLTANTKISPAGISWMCYLSPLYYGIEMVLTYFKDCDGFSDQDQTTINNILTGDGQGQLDMQAGMVGRDLFIIAAIGIFGRGLAFWFADNKNKIVR